jgi:transcriptional regulator with XRE-family HTH domain
VVRASGELLTSCGGFLGCQPPHDLIRLTYVQGSLYTALKINAEVQMERIRQLRKVRGLSQARLAVMADMDPATLNRLERGTGNPNLKTLERVADALDVGIADLLEETSPKAQSPLPLEEFAAGPAMLGRVLDAARQDAKKNTQAANRERSSEGTPQTTSGFSGTISGFAEDKVRSELRSLGFPDAFFEGLLWPLAERVTELERQIETRDRQPEDRRSTTRT